MDGEGGPIFAQQMQHSGQHVEAQRALADIQEKHADIIRIEKSILLNQLFMDLAALVATQGDMLNQIDHNVSNAVEYTDKGVEELKKAVKSQ
ncbi:MAG: neuronal Q-snares in complex with R-snare motif of Tomosyn, partial [Olpidium bornovanus]